MSSCLTLQSSYDTPALASFRGVLAVTLLSGYHYTPLVSYPDPTGGKYKVRGTSTCSSVGTQVRPSPSSSSTLVPRPVFTTGQGASAMGLTAYKIYLVFLSQFNGYQEDVEKNRAAKRQRYKEDLKENRAAKRQKYEDNSAAIKARNRYWNDPAVRLTKRAAERRSIAGVTELSLPPKEPQNSSVMLSLYVGASVVQSPPVTSVMASGMWYCLSRPPIPKLGVDEF
ncbi:hypothetical protein EMCRGX_G002227 [Ephydatia muelleri]|eukprot:Em0001g2002a